ncbi:hypothetical protein F5B19DRAFT_335815 [Rostrohypoxylon terebratum]|nr:hypothetical protein F5B19DRAFT_335815 [Rostrohypoxylon terebratum]
MKLIVVGSTGFVGAEFIRQAMSHPGVTSVIALGRRRVAMPENAGPGADATKLTCVVYDDFEDYPESVEQKLAGADACIWRVNHSMHLLVCRSPGAVKIGRMGTGLARPAVIMLLRAPRLSRNFLAGMAAKAKRNRSVGYTSAHLVA